MSSPALLREQFVVIDPALNAHPEPLGPGFYEGLDARYEGFRGCLLVAEYGFDRDWPTWECHPAGDELIYLLEGRAELLLRLPAGTHSVVLETPGSQLRVPRGVWHTARVSGRCRLLFVTPGEGTQNAAEPPDAGI